MTSNAPISLSELRRNPISILEIGYKIAFLPYVTLFSLYVISGVVAGFIAFYFGVSKEVIEYKYFPLFCAGAVLIFLARSSWRRFSNRRARAKSLNPGISILDEINTLTFKEGDVVEYRSIYKVRARKAGITSMSFVLQWNGKIEDVAVGQSDGCGVTLRSIREASGMEVRVEFGRVISKKFPYTFEYSLLFNNYNGIIRKYLRKVQPYLAEDNLIQTIILEDVPKRRFIEAVYRASNIMSPLIERYVISEDPRHTFRIHRPIQGWSYKTAAQEDES